MGDMKKEFLKECYVCETNRYDALTEEVWSQLNVNNKLFLGYCEDKDKEKVYVQINVDGDEEPRIIGVLSKEDSESIIKYVKMSWGNSLYNTVISRFDDKADENKRLSVVIYIVKNPIVDKSPQVVKSPQE